MSSKDGVVNFRVSAIPGVEVPLGPIPFRGGIVLKDFTSDAVLLGDFELSRVRLEVLAGGSVIVEIPPRFDPISAGKTLCSFNTHFTAGILIGGGERVTLRLHGPGTMTVSVGALIQNPQS